MRKIRAGNINMLVSKNAKICATPKANPQLKQVNYLLRWVPNAKFLCWACTFYIVCVNFVHAGHPTQTLFPVEYELQVFFKDIYFICLINV